MGNFIISFEGLETAHPATLSPGAPFVFDVMGLKKTNILQKGDNKLEEVIDIILELRNDARKNKNFELGDKIRDMLKDKGISINDSDKNSSFTACTTIS